jgi:c-di-GMP-binding flagellar brake protein YcgR
MSAYGPLRINQPIEIEIREPGYEGVYRSRVEGISGESLTLAAPYRNSEVIHLPRGTEVTVSYFDQVAVYFVECLVLSYNLGHVPTVVLGSPINTKRVQRRNFVRLDTRIPMRYMVLDDNMQPLSEEFTATTVDISGGGLMFTTGSPIEQGNTLEIRVCFDDGTTLTAIGKAVRVIDNVSGQDKKSVGVEFSLIEERERDKIIRFIFNQQRELRQRGLL